LRDAYGRNAGLRLDHFLLNKMIAPRLKAAQVDKNVRGWAGSSDHAPVWIELAENGILAERKSKERAARPVSQLNPLKSNLKHC
jgi:hypothetical protein